MDDHFAICKHGVKIGLQPCKDCANDQSLRFIHRRIDDMGALIAEIKKDHDNWLNEHDNRLDGIEQRLLKLESHYYSDGDISAIHGCIRNIEKNMEYDEHQVKRLEERLNNLEEQAAIHKTNLNRKWDANTELSQRLTEVETELNTVRALGSRAYHPRKPHKCPVCDGSGFSATIRKANDGFEVHGILVEKDETFMHTENCTPCQGKGIVWG